MNKKQIGIFVTGLVLGGTTGYLRAGWRGFKAYKAIEKDRDLFREHCEAQLELLKDLQTAETSEEVEAIWERFDTQLKFLDIADEEM